MKWGKKKKKSTISLAKYKHHSLTPINNTPKTTLSIISAESKKPTL